MTERERSLILLLVNIAHHLEHDANNEDARQEFIHEIKVRANLPTSEQTIAA